jgi:hypothetical protein
VLKNTILHMKKLLIATNNKGKIKELQDLLKDTGHRTRHPRTDRLDLDVIEDGLHLRRERSQKSDCLRPGQRTDLPRRRLRLEVDALDGAPGLYFRAIWLSNGGKLSDGAARLSDKICRQTPSRGPRASTPRLPLPSQMEKQLALPEGTSTMVEGCAKARSSPKNAAQADLATTQSSSCQNWGKPWQN